MPIEDENKPVVVADTNVIVSALNFGGKPRDILDLSRTGEIRLCISPFILAEVKMVLAQDFGWSDPDVEEAIRELANTAIVINPTSRVSVVTEKDDDNRIIECAVEGKARLIVSGDKRHLLPIKEYAGIKIVSPDEFLRRRR